MKGITKLGTLFLVLSLTALMFTGCSGNNDAGETPDVTPAPVNNETPGEQPEELKTITYFTAKAPTDDVVTTIQEVADQYIAEGNNIELKVDTAADRAAYDQKLRTLVAADQMPDMFEIDANPYCKELGDTGKLVDIEAFLNEIGVYDKYISISIEYQRLPDGRIYTIPLEFSTEMTWYNVDIFNQYGLTPPQTFDEWLDICDTLSENGVTPLAIDGVDGWPIMRYIAMIPFRKAGNDYLQDLSTGNAKLSDEIGMDAINFVAEIGPYFQKGFSSTDYTTAKDLFLNGKTAMFEIGTWELNNFLAENLPEGLNVDYFYMPMTENSVTAENEYWAFGGIGLACTQSKFDSRMEDFITYLINNYDAKYLQKQHYPPTKVNLPDESQFDPLFIRIMKDQANYGEIACKPWDTMLSADVNMTMSANLVALALGEMTPEECAEAIDDSLEQTVE